MALEKPTLPVSPAESVQFSGNQALAVVVPRLGWLVTSRALVSLPTTIGKLKANAKIALNWKTEPLAEGLIFFITSSLGAAPVKSVPSTVPAACGWLGFKAQLGLVYQEKCSIRDSTGSDVH